MVQLAVLPAREESVLTGAVCRAAEFLGLKQSELAGILGVSAPTISRMKNGSYTLNRDRKEFEIAALLVRVFRSLDAITGGDVSVNQNWIRNRNEALGGVPVEMLQSIYGLTNVIGYLDCRRAPV
ncbi:MAG: antitoxin Xre-like helix-turn-helix domain-containing protein [Pseudomonadota bacterium]